MCTEDFLWSEKGVSSTLGTSATPGSSNLFIFLWDVRLVLISSSLSFLLQRICYDVIVTTITRSCSSDKWSEPWLSLVINITLLLPSAPIRFNNTQSKCVCLSVPVYQIMVAVVGVKNVGMIIFTFFIEPYNCVIICYDANTIVSGLIV